MFLSGQRFCALHHGKGYRETTIVRDRNMDAERPAADVGQNPGNRLSIGIA
jgi:hypothetical protein